MKIFSPPESKSSKGAESSASVKKGPKSKKHAAPAEKKAVSDLEIREKLAAHVETSNTAKSKVLEKNSKAFGAGFLKSEADTEDSKKDSVKEAHLLLSDVKLNDPNDSDTHEKLKTVLRNGAFNFNPKEKETLEKILAD